MKKNILFCIIILLGLSGCSHTSRATQAKLTAVDGKFYMIGDSNCTYYKKRDDHSIDCADNNQLFTGYRNALSDQELQYVMHREQIELQRQQVEAAENANTMNQTNNYINQLNRYKPVNCMRTGNFVQCY